MLPGIDLFSLRLSSILASIAFGLVFAGLWRGRRHEAFLLFWSASSFLYAADLIGFEIAGHPPLLLGCTLYGVLAVVNLLAVSGLRHLEGRAPFASWMAGVILATMVAYGLPVLLRGHWTALPAALVTISRAGGLILSMAITGTVMLRSAQRAGSRGGMLSGIAMLAYIPGYLIAIAGAMGWQNGQHALALLPMLSDQLLLGVLNLGLLAVPVERSRAKLEEAALRDPLTGAWNRAGFAKCFGAFAGKGGMIVAIDIDHFKRLNDRFGHAAGDAALVDLAQTAMAIAKPLGGDVARMGGDEFLVLLPDATPVTAQAFARTLRTGLVFSVDAGRWTISIGIAALFAHEDQAEAALQRADAALYRAKAQGRDRVAA